MSRRLKVGIMAALLLLSVGFAAITTTLVINGTLSIGPDGASFDQDVIFSRVKMYKGTGDAVIAADGKSLSFKPVLMDIGEEADLRFDIINQNRQYDANAKIKCDFVDQTNAFNDYITIKADPEKFDVPAGSKGTGHVIVRMIKSFAGDETIDEGNIQFKCVIDMEAGEREELAPELPEVYKDPVLNGADPILTTGLVPITIDTDGKVIYANSYKKWYDYTSRRWANAVLLEDGKTASYEEGDPIKEEDIRAYFVWIPRYRYKLWNVDGTNVVNSEDIVSASQSIEIQFENKNTEPATGSKNGEWLTHPAFTSLNVNGIWVGKYETTVRDGYTGGNKPNNPEVIAIKPMNSQWINIKAGGMFKSAYNYNRDLDSHMMKNTEWGAVAYLSHSEYGINTEVRVNTLTIGGTGYAATNQPSCVDASKSCNGWVNNTLRSNAYNTETGYLASTTGNIYGVYDMAGGREEIMASYVDGGSLDFMAMKTADVEKYAGKYLDIYEASSTSSSFGNRILGDATGELGLFYNYEDEDNSKTGIVTKRTHSAWYNDVAIFTSSDYPMFRRGGTANSGTLSGQFAFNSTSGSNSSTSTFRVVLSPQ